VLGSIYLATIKESKGSNQRDKMSSGAAAAEMITALQNKMPVGHRIVTISF
jgi:hypothetical protein